MHVIKWQILFKKWLAFELGNNAPWNAFRWTWPIPLHPWNLNDPSTCIHFFCIRDVKTIRFWRMVVRCWSSNYIKIFRQIISSLRMALIGNYDTLHWADYFVIVLVLIGSVGIGIFHSRKQKSTEQYLMANRKVPIIPAAASLMISYLSAVTLLGDSTEIYFYGITFAFYIIAVWASVIVCMEIFVPLFYPLKITSVQEVSFGNVHRF